MKSLSDRVTEMGMEASWQVGAPHSMYLFDEHRPHPDYIKGCELGARSFLKLRNMVAGDVGCLTRVPSWAQHMPKVGELWPSTNPHRNVGNQAAPKKGARWTHHAPSWSQLVTRCASRPSVPRVEACFSAFVLLYLSTSTILLFLSIMCFCCSTSCSSASLLLVFTVSLFFAFFCFILSCFYPKWSPRVPTWNPKEATNEILK